MNKKTLFIFALFLVSLFAYAVYAQPTGANVTEVTEQTWGGQSPEGLVVQGGNISALSVDGKSKTLVWQGFYGNASGNLTLADSAGDQMYSWQVLNMTGEIYASRSNAVTWATITGHEDCDIELTLTGGGPDRVSNTFTNTTLSQIWQIGDVNVSQACRTYTYNTSNNGNNFWEEIILTDTVNFVYAGMLWNHSISNTQGFNDGTSHFQFMVPDKKGAPTETYYFYIEFS